jgi:dihydrolipoamide dehydrogenase
MVEALPRLAPLEDDDLSKAVTRAFRKRGITTAAGAAVTSIVSSDTEATVIYDADGTSTTVAADICLVAIGRGPVTEGLGVAEAGVALDQKGYVQVDDRLRTSVPGVWAVGDVAATPLQLAHVAFTEGIAVAERIAGIDVPPIDYTQIPRVTYSSPEIASVGLTEAEARASGREIVVEKLDFRAIGKANIVGEGGLVKVVAEANDGPVLGVHMVGPHVTDLIAEGMLITAWEASPSDVAAHIHPHPTLSEGIGEAMLALAGKALHTP